MNKIDDLLFSPAWVEKRYEETLLELQITAFIFIIFLCLFKVFTSFLSFSLMLFSLFVFKVKKDEQEQIKALTVFFSVIYRGDLEKAKELLPRECPSFGTFRGRTYADFFDYWQNYSAEKKIIGCNKDRAFLFLAVRDFWDKKKNRALVVGEIEKMQPLFQEKSIEKVTIDRIRELGQGNTDPIFIISKDDLMDLYQGAITLS